MATRTPPEPAGLQLLSPDPSGSAAPPRGPALGRRACALARRQTPPRRADLLGHIARSARLERGVDVRVELRPLPAFGRDVHRLHPVRSRALEDDRVFDVAHHDRDLAIGGEVNFAHLFPFSFEGITFWA